MGREGLFLWHEEERLLFADSGEGFGEELAQASGERNDFAGGSDEICIRLGLVKVLEPVQEVLREFERIEAVAKRLSAHCGY